MRDRERGIYTDPSKVHPIGHKGKYFTVPGAHLSEPSPPANPVALSGRNLAARPGIRGAECRSGVSGRHQHRRHSPFDRRHPVAGGGTRTRRRRHQIHYRRDRGDGGDRRGKQKPNTQSFYPTPAPRLPLALFSAWTGIDWSQYPLDHPLEYIETNAGRSALAGLTSIDADRQWTVAGIAEYIGIGGIHPKLVGGPAEGRRRTRTYRR